MGRRAQLSSRWLASTVALAYLAVSATVGITLLVSPKPPGAQATPTVTTLESAKERDPRDVPRVIPNSSDDSGARGTTSTTTPPPTTTPAPTSTAPAGFQRVSGPAGIQTVIPNGWRTMRSTGPGSAQASDPDDAGRYVKYGGSPAPGIGIEPSHIEYEHGFAARSIDYRRIALSSATYGGHDAVEWEFEHHDGTRLLHVRSLYWRTSGNEYFVLAAAPTTKWPAMLPVYDAMVANATP
jgi:hypothetical protein